MNTIQFQILILDSEATVAQYLAELGPDSKITPHIANNGRDGLRIMRAKARALDVVLIDADIAGADDFSVLRQIRNISIDISIVVIGSFSSPILELEARKFGVQEFIEKPSHGRIRSTILAHLKKHPRAAGSPQQPYMEDLGDGQFFLAVSPAMHAIQRQVCMLSKVDVPVLITGESGAGKEVVAQLLHRNSLRASRQLLKVNCAALPVDLLESELFGYEAGAFTGALKSKPGKFEQCDGGTILLDEIGEMSPQLQAKLLHVLQDGTFSRLGGRVTSKVNVRVIAATNVDIEKAIAEKLFREDLYYRLNAFVINVPPLRERRESIPYFLNELATRFAVMNHLEPAEFSSDLIAAAVRYSWPGNIRELGNFVKRYLITRDPESALIELQSKTGTRTRAFVLPHTAAASIAPASGLKAVVRSVKDETESRIIQDVLVQTKWNRRIAAEQLQISYKALLYKIRLYNLEVSA